MMALKETVVALEKSEGCTTEEQAATDSEEGRKSVAVMVAKVYDYSTMAHSPSDSQAVNPSLLCQNATTVQIRRNYCNRVLKRFSRRTSWLHEQVDKGASRDDKHRPILAGLEIPLFP